MRPKLFVYLGAIYGVFLWTAAEFHQQWPMGVDLVMLTVIVAICAAAGWCFNIMKNGVL